MSRVFAFLFLTASVYGQSTATPAKDPLDRTTPQLSVLHFLEACHSRDYNKASNYLDLRKVSPADRGKTGLEDSKQLEDLLDDTRFDIATMSRDPEGDLNDGLPPNMERIYTYHVGDQSVTLHLERVALKSDLQVWLVSAQSVEKIPQAHKMIAETAFEKRLPQPLVTIEFLDTPIWRWFALLGMGILLWITGGLLAKAAVALIRPLVAIPGLRGPLRAILAVAGMRIALELAPPAALSRLFIERVLGLGFSLALAWGAMAFVDHFAESWHSRLDPRVQAVSFSVLPLGKTMLNVTLFLIAVLSVFSAWGYNTSTILAGLGVGGLAVALAAQKTIENLFGGISVIGDRPVLVGDVCRFGDRTGTVMDIGLRSTRIRTPERTVISVPNGQFSSMALENISSRDKVWFHQKLHLKRETTPDQLQKLLDSVRKVLTGNDKVESGKLPVRFVEVTPTSLDVEVSVYVKTSDGDEFLAVQQDLLIRILRAVEEAGTGLATAD
jgi:MscS family membrane protein